jgi:hypothetical protein
LELPNDEAEALRVDLTNAPETLKSWQCRRNRELRAQAYQSEADRLYLAAQADGDSLDVWLDKRAEIKARYPWAGAYR